MPDTIINNIAKDLVCDVKLVDATSQTDNKKLYENIYNKTVKELELFLDKNILETKQILVLVDTATVYNKPNKNYRIYEKYNGSDEYFGIIGAKSWLEPFNKPLLIEHLDGSNFFDGPSTPIGRVLYTTDNDNVNYVGSYVSDKDAIDKIRDKRFWSKSVGFYVYRPKCSICGSDIDIEYAYSGLKCTGNKQKGKDIIQHEIGTKYDNQVAYLVCNQVFKEISYVSNPATPESKTEYFKIYGSDSEKSGYNINSISDNVNKNIMVYEYDTIKKFYMPGNDINNKTSTKTPANINDNKNDKNVDDNPNKDKIESEKSNSKKEKTNMSDMEKHDNSELLSKIDNILNSIEAKVDSFEEKIVKAQATIQEKDNEIKQLQETVKILTASIDTLKEQNGLFYKTSLIDKIKKLITDLPGFVVPEDSVLEKKSIDELESFITLIECRSDFLTKEKNDKQTNEPKSEQVEPKIKDNVNIPAKQESVSTDKIDPLFVKRVKILKNKQNN